VVGNGWATWHEICEDKHKVLVWRSEIKIPLGRYTESRIILKKDIRVGGVDWINLAHEMCT